MTRKEYNRYSELYCHFCQTVLQDKADLRYMYLNANTVVKICLSCLSIVDSGHKMKTEELK